MKEFEVIEIRSRRIYASNEKQALELADDLLPLSRSEITVTEIFDEWEGG